MIARRIFATLAPIAIVGGLLFNMAGIANAAPVEGGGSTRTPQVEMWLEVYFESQPPRPANVIKLPCSEDETPVIQHHTWTPAEGDRWFADGDRYNRLCVHNDVLGL